MQVSGIAEGKFKDDFKRRMMTFDSLILGVMMYEIESIEWRVSPEMDTIQLKYTKWSPGLYLCTPGYIVLAETNRKKTRIKAGRRAMKFD